MVLLLSRYIPKELICLILSNKYKKVKFVVNDGEENILKDESK